MDFTSRGALLAAIIAFVLIAGIAVVPLMAVMPEVSAETKATETESTFAIALVAVVGGAVPAIVTYFAGAAVAGSRRRARVAAR